MNIQNIDLDLLNPAEYNPRIITDDEFNGLCESLKIFGQQENLIVNKDMTIISGHQRYEAMKFLGWTEAVCNMVDLDKHAEKKLNVLMNSQAISGKYDDLKLAEILEELKLDDDYEGLRLDKLEPLDLSEIDVEEDEAPELNETAPPISRLGEVYQLGRHRIMCGSSTEQGDLNTLVQLTPINMIYTDPPYGVSYKSKTLGSIMNDELQNDDLYQFTYDAFYNALQLSQNDCAIYCWYEDKYRYIIQRAVEDAGAEYKQNLIWNKGMNLSGADYQKAHENCLYLQIKGNKAKWSGARDKKTILGKRRRDLTEMKKELLINMILNMQKEQTVWDFDRDNVTTYSHPTQKPVTLAAQAIFNSSDDQDTVLDMFSGSGSTLIACEQTDRICYGMEIDPKYVDVIRKRYWKFTHDGNEEGWEDGTSN